MVQIRFQAQTKIVKTECKYFQLFHCGPQLLTKRKSLTTIIDFLNWWRWRHSKTDRQTDRVMAYLAPVSSPTSLTNDYVPQSTSRITNWLEHHSLYQCSLSIKSQRIWVFWKSAAGICNKPLFWQDYKDLFNGCFHSNPEEQWTDREKDEPPLSAQILVIQTSQQWDRSLLGLLIISPWWLVS